MAERGSDKRKLSPQLSTPTASTETRYRSRLKQHEKLPPSRTIAQQSRDSPRLSLSTVHQNSQEPLRSSEWNNYKCTCCMCVQIIIYMSRLMFVGFACSSRVRKVLSKDYTTPKEAQTSLMALTSKLPARVSSEPQALSISYVRIQIMCKLCTIIHRTAWGIKCMHGPLMR